MSRKQEDVEVSDGDGDSFEPTTDEALRYVIDRWGYIGNKIVIEGRVTEISSTIHLRRGKFQFDHVTERAKLEPANLKCDLIVDKPIPEIEETGDDLAIVGLVFRRFGSELALQAQRVMVEHMQHCYPEPPKEGIRIIDTRVSAGERRDTAEEKSSVEF